jgi:mono/diheme cytochrome c family protein
MTSKQHAGWCRGAVLGAALSLAAGAVVAGGEAAPDLGEAFLSDPANIATGEALWAQQCRHCHGRSAYPGKAPKLKPRKYTPQFVFDRVTNGFRKMPAWKEVYSEDERRAIVAYVLSREFSP